MTDWEYYDVRQAIDEEQERFQNSILEQRVRYHSIALSEEQPALSSFDYNYKPSEIPGQYDPTFASSPRTAFARFIPQDGRIKLAFDFQWQAEKEEYEWKLRTAWSARKIEEHQKYLQKNAESKIESLESFGKEIQTLGNFCILDVDPSTPENGHVFYNLGCPEPYVVIQEDIPGEKNREPICYLKDDQLYRWLDTQTRFGQPTPRIQTAPWQRIILCQGVSLLSPARIRQRAFPFLAFNDENDPINMATNIHLSCERMGGSDLTNLYSDPRTAFHITFYEKLTGPNIGNLIKESHERNLRIGRFYGKQSKDSGKNSDGNSNELAFRQSSFTVITTSRHAQKNPQPDTQLIMEDYWTMLVLSPSGFFNSPLELLKNGPEVKRDKGWKIVMGQRSQQTAEFSIILYALKKVEERWRQFNEHIGSLLVEDFMDPEAYSKLLFDDETFSRSKLYFWAIGCLNEFKLSIEDNIKQLRLFRKDRVPHPPKPPAKSPALPFLLQELLDLDQEAGKIELSLEELKAQFEAKLVTIQALRDGLFNATSVREASLGNNLAALSTRLATVSARLAKESSRQNRYILVFTVATVFYLPISFVATFYSMHLFDPNGNSVESQTPFIVTVILVSLATYMVAGWGLWLVDNGQREDMNREVRLGEGAQGQAKEVHEAAEVGTSKANGCLNFLRRCGKNSEAV